MISFSGRLAARFVCCAVIITSSTLFNTAARGQFKIPSPAEFKGFNAAQQGEQKPPLTLKSVFTEASTDVPARLYITADIQPGWHTYSITMAKGGPVTTKIKLPESKEYKLLDGFTTAPPPAIHTYAEFPGILVEEHVGRVHWHAPIEFSAGVEPAKLKIEGKVFYQACDENNCIPPKDAPFAATLGKAPELPAEDKAKPQAPAKTSAAPAKAGSGIFKSPKAHATIRGSIQPAIAAPGETVQLTLRAEPAELWHIYPWGERVPISGARPTLIGLTNTNGWSASRPQADSQPIEKPADKPGDEDQVYHEGPVTWTVEIQVPADARPGQYSIAGLMGYQTCADKIGCDLPTAARFEAPLEVGLATVAGEVLLAFSDAKYNDAAKLVGQASVSAPQPAGVSNQPATAPSVSEEPRSDSPTASSATAEPESLAWMLLLAFAGGFALNLMPCVLPVIGLKVLSFVEQSGQDRKRVWMLNVWYSLGLISVFMVLATLAAVAGLGWGQQFTRPEFSITMTCLVFVFALSFLGVWEIPIPGFVGTGKAQYIAEQEGPMGAFTKGILTTILATPCSGPFMGTALIWAFRQPPHVIYATFGCLGLGMASPYLVIGAYPQLIGWLPRPGAWMETFKQLMGFVLLGTVVWMLTIVSWTYVVPTIAMMMGLWAACWWVGRTPLTADMPVKLRAWGWAAVVAGATGVVSFNWLSDVMQSRFNKLIDVKIAEREESQPAGSSNVSGGSVALQSLLRDRAEKLQSTPPHDLPWQAFTKNRVELLKEHRYTVLIDFTASWCPTCISNKTLAFNTTETRKVVDANNVITLVADMSDLDAATPIIKYLHELGNPVSLIPYYAIFPANRPNQPILFDGIVTQQRIIDELQRAGPSVAGRGNATALQNARSKAGSPTTGKTSEHRGASARAIDAIATTAAPRTP